VRIIESWVFTRRSCVEVGRRRGRVGMVLNASLRMERRRLGRLLGIQSIRLRFVGLFGLVGVVRMGRGSLCFAALILLSG
jgi:hypothetical protein